MIRPSSLWTPFHCSLVQYLIFSQFIARVTTIVNGTTTILSKKLFLCVLARWWKFICYLPVVERLPSIPLCTWVCIVFLCSLHPPEAFWSVECWHYCKVPEHPYHSHSTMSLFSKIIMSSWKGLYMRVVTLYVSCCSWYMPYLWVLSPCASSLILLDLSPNRGEPSCFRIKSLKYSSPSKQSSNPLGELHLVFLYFVIVS